MGTSSEEVGIMLEDIIVLWSSCYNNYQAVQVGVSLIALNYCQERI